MLARIDKQSLLRQVQDRLLRDLAQVSAAQKSAQEGAVHEDNRAEGDKDMRSTEASYVARGQAARVLELQAEAAAIDNLELRPFGEGTPLAWGALVSIEGEGGQVTHHFLLPAGAGIRLQQDGGIVSVVSTRSPLGQALLGSFVGDEIHVDREDSSLEWTILDCA